MRTTSAAQPTGCLQKKIRGIAQSGSAPALGAGCREFESLYPDHFSHRFAVMYFSHIIVASIKPIDCSERVYLFRVGLLSISFAQQYG